MKTIAVLILLFLCSPPAQAQQENALAGTAVPDWVTVELVVFEQLFRRDDEAPAPGPFMPDLGHAVVLEEIFATLEGPVPESPPVEMPEAVLPPLAPLAPPTAPLPDFLPVPEDHGSLEGTLARLKQSREYRVLAQSAWRQRASGRVRPVRITGGEVLEFREPAPRGAVANPVDPNAGPEPVHEIDGTATVFKSRFLHLNLDLVLREPRRAGPMRLRDDERGPPAWRLSENRRLEPGQMQYFDHHRFGVIARVRPWEAPAEPPAAERTSSAQGPSDDTADPARDN